jgi:hypothetical protein
MVLPAGEWVACGAVECGHAGGGPTVAVALGTPARCGGPRHPGATAASAASAASGGLRRSGGPGGPGARAQPGAGMSGIGHVRDGSSEAEPGRRGAAAAIGRGAGEAPDRKVAGKSGSPDWAGWRNGSGQGSRCSPTRRACASSSCSPTTRGDRRRWRGSSGSAGRPSAGRSGCCTRPPSSATCRRLTTAEFGSSGSIPTTPAESGPSSNRPSWACCPIAVRRGDAGSSTGTADALWVVPLDWKQAAGCLNRNPSSGGRAMGGSA